MNVKDHYDQHLSHFYSWMIGDFDQRKNEFLVFCNENKIRAGRNDKAVDLGAGNGIQSIALAELGFEITAIDFSSDLLNELKLNSKGFNIKTINGDIRGFSTKIKDLQNLIVCCGDTIAHLNSFDELIQLIKDCYDSLCENGKLILTFRDYSGELIDTMRFIPIRNDNNKILTCFLECIEGKVRVTDLLYENNNNEWIQKVSSYEKIRISKSLVVNFLVQNSFEIVSTKTNKGMIAVVAEKNNFNRNNTSVSI